MRFGYRFVGQTIIIMGLIAFGSHPSITCMAGPKPTPAAATTKKPAAKKPAAPANVAKNNAPAKPAGPERGKLSGGHVRLCPGEQFQMDLYPQLEYQVGARYNATVVSSNPTQVQATTQVDQRNHAILHARAGRNTSDQEQVVRLSITAHIDRLQVGIPPQQRGQGSGIHGSGPNSVPHQIDPNANYTRSGVIDIHVLGARDCTQQPEPVAAQPTQPAGNSSWYRIEHRVCANSWTSDAIRERGPGIDLPPVRRVQMQSNSNPGVATIKVYGVPNQAAQYRYPVIWQVNTHGEGEAVIRLIEPTPPVNTQAYHRELVIKVEHCDEAPPMVDILERTNTAIKRTGKQYKEIPPLTPKPSSLDID